MLGLQFEQVSRWIYRLKWKASVFQSTLIRFRKFTCTYAPTLKFAIKHTSFTAFFQMIVSKLVDILIRYYIIKYLFVLLMMQQYFLSFIALLYFVECRSQNISWYMMILDKFLNVVLVGETIDKIGRLTTNLLLVSSMLCYQLKYRQQQKETAKHCAVYKIGFQKRQISRLQVEFFLKNAENSHDY